MFISGMVLAAIEVSLLNTIAAVALAESLIK